MIPTERMIYLEKRDRELEAAIEAQKSIISQLKDSQHQVRIELSWLKFGVRPGSIVLYGSKKKRMKVTSVDPEFWGNKNRPWVKAVGMRNDGTWSIREQNIYDSWKPEPVVGSTA